MNVDMLLPVLQILEVMKKNIQNKSFLRSIKAITRKIKRLFRKKVLDKSVFENLSKLRTKKLPNSYEKVIDNIIMPILNIFKYSESDYAKNPYIKNVFLEKTYYFNITSNKAVSYS